MRIAMIAPLEMRVPPLGYGGTELVVSLLTEALARRGHDVTLFASGDSETQARLLPGCGLYLRGSERHKGILNMLNVMACLERADEFDIIHNHTCFEGLATAGLVRTPVLTTLHGGLDGDWLLLFERYRGWYNTISESAAKQLPPKPRFAGIVYNAIDCQSYPFRSTGRGDHMLYLSRISREKGAHLAIELARRSGRRLVLAGNVDDADRDFFETEVRSRLGEAPVDYVGEANQARKRELLQEAHCLVAPITWEEPFGLFLVEAMACGTPVVAFGRGAASEVVAHGVTGFVVDTLDEMARAVERVDGIDPAACRDRAISRFDVPRMTDDYLAAYTRVMEEALKEARSHRPRAVRRRWRVESSLRPT